MLGSKNASSADNQQEKQIGWIVGFVDGEGTFSVSIHRNSTSKLGWQVLPEFVITQGAKSLACLEEIKVYFQCGQIYRNKRYDNHKEDLFKYCVRSRKDLETVIIPFFTNNVLKTAKAEDFNKFAEIIELMNRNEHLTIDGIRKIAKIVETMNQRKISRYLLSSETKR